MSSSKQKTHSKKCTQQPSVKENLTKDFKYLTDFISKYVAENIIADISKNSKGYRKKYVVDFTPKCIIDKLILKAAEKTKLNQHEGQINSFVKSIMYYIGVELIANVIDNIIRDKDTDNAKDTAEADDKTTEKNSIKIEDIIEDISEDVIREKSVDQIRGAPIDIIEYKRLIGSVPKGFKKIVPEYQNKGAPAYKIEDKINEAKPEDTIKRELVDKIKVKPKHQIEDPIKGMLVNRIDGIFKRIAYCLTNEIIPNENQMSTKEVYGNTFKYFTKSSVGLFNAKFNSPHSLYNDHDNDSDGFVTEEEVSTDADISEEEQSKEHKFVESRTVMRTIVQFVAMYVVEEIVQRTANRVVQSTGQVVTMDLTEYINDYVTDELIQSVAVEVMDTVAESLTEKITAFIMGFISDNVMFNAIVNITRPRITRKSKGKREPPTERSSVSHESSQAKSQGKSASLTEGSSVSHESSHKISKAKSESTERSSVYYEPNQGISKAKSVSLTESSSVSNELIRDKREDAVRSENVNLEMISKNRAKSRVDSEVEDLFQQTQEYIADFVTDYCTEELFKDTIDGKFTDSSDSQSITFPNVTSGTSIEKIPKLNASYPMNPHAATLMWKTFSDDDYMSGNIDVTVQSRSFFTYIVVEEQPMYIVNVPRRPTLDFLLREMVTKNLGASVRIKIDDRCFDCIPKLLKIHSPFFATQDWRVEHFEFKSSDVPITAFEIIYDWVRFQKPIQLINAVKVIQAARHLKFDMLVTDCWKLISQPRVREKIAFELFLEAEQLPDLDDVRDILLSRVRGYFLALVGSDLFLNLQREQLLSLLERDSIGVNTEAEVFFAAVRWLSKSEERLSDMKTVMRCVRFEYMSMPMLFAVRDMGKWKDVRPIGTTDRVLQEFQKDPEMPQMLLEAMTYISLHFQNEIEPDPKSLSPAVKQLYILPRRWMYHPKCPYHLAHLVYPYQHILSQHDFNKFIKSIQMDWMGSEPPMELVLSVEFDGVKMLSPSLRSQCESLPTVEPKRIYKIVPETTSESELTSDH